MRRRPLAFALAVSCAPLFAADGDLDDGFGTGGKTTRAYPLDGAATDVRLAVESGRSLLLSTCLDSNSVGIVRFEADGSNDAGYGTLGFRTLDLRGDSDTWDDFPGLHVLSDGKLLVIGSWTGENTQAFVPRLVRLTTGGDLDADFGDGGISQIDELPGTPHPDRDFTYRSTAIDSEGRIVIAGVCTLCPSNSDNDVFVVRLLATGAVDTSFGSNGWFTFDIGEGNANYPAEIVLDDLDRIYVRGWAAVPGTQPFVARLIEAGELDADWGDGGIAALDPSDFGFNQEAMVWDPVSGGVVLASSAVGVNGRPTGLARLMFNGDPDTTFGVDGFADLSGFDEGTYIHDLAIQSDRRIVAIGTINGNGSQLGGFFLARTLADGTLDDTFDGNGVKRVEFDRTTDAFDEALDLALVGGRLVAAGRSTALLPPAHFALLRTDNALVFTDGFELGSTWLWSARTD